MIFETGYGPSGLPHIGTFGEVARTSMVRHAFRVLTDDKIKTRLIAFSDDMDGLRKVPDNVPQQGPAGAAPRQAADAGARPVRHPPQLRRAQQCAAARLSRSVRLRLRVPVGDGVLHVRPLRRRADKSAGALRSGDGDHAAVAARGAGADLFAVSADFSANRHRAAGAGGRPRRRGRHHHLSRTPTAASASPRPSPAGAASCNGSPIGPCAGSRSASTTKWPARI